MADESFCRVIVRHELPTVEGRFVIQAYGFGPISFGMEEGIPVLYEVAITSDDDSSPWPHHYWWIKTGESLPESLRQESFVGTARFPDGRVLHLFRFWES